jgi:hypothetical protein
MSAYWKVKILLVAQNLECSSRLVQKGEELTVKLSDPFDWWEVTSKCSGAYEMLQYVLAVIPLWCTRKTVKSAVGENEVKYIAIFSILRI